VHFQGFPDFLYNQEILSSKEYFGQYGHIIKIVLVSKEDKIQKRKSNSAYLTFENEEQAAYCILAVDSIKINNHIVRAFFGTTKYCTHFLNNFKCFNEDKCMFMHHMANPADIIDENTKFNYNDHIKLAKKIIDYENEKNKRNVLNKTFKFKSILPNIKYIYSKEKIDIYLQDSKECFNNNHHFRQNSNSSNNSTANNSLNKSNNRTLSHSPKNKENNKNKNETQINNLKLNIFDSKSKNKSRFFDIYDNIENTNQENKNLFYIANSLLNRKIFFEQFKDYNKEISFENLEKDLCKKLYEKTKDEKIKSLFENKFI
jgi:CCR4-NOT transcription complex subunit 4